MPETREELLEKQVLADGKIKELQQQVADYRASEHERIAKVREEMAEVRAEINKLKGKLSHKKRQTLIKKGPIRTLERRIRTRRNAIFNAEENKEWKAYSAMFRAKKNKILRI